MPIKLGIWLAIMVLGLAGIAMMFFMSRAAKLTIEEQAAWKRTRIPPPAVILATVGFALSTIILVVGAGGFIYTMLKGLWS